MSNLGQSKLVTPYFSEQHVKFTFKNNLFVSEKQNLKYIIDGCIVNIGLSTVQKGFLFILFNQSFGELMHFI